MINQVKMRITCRKYRDINDYKLIRTFLENTYESYGTRFDNNLTLFEFQCALSCGLKEPAISIDKALDKVFLWFYGEELVGMLQDDSFCIAIGYRFIFDEIVNVAEKFYSEEDNNFEMSVYENDIDYENVLLNRGYCKTEEYWVRRDLDFNDTLEAAAFPHGFYVESVWNLKELEEVYKAYKLCYGVLFNNNIFEHFYKTSTYRKELDLVVVDQNNHILALCSGRYDEKNKLVTIEAVSCFHEYRRKGISKALLLYALKISKDLGADKATVYTAMPEKYPAPNRLYESVGFKLIGNIYVWEKIKV